MGILMIKFGLVVVLHLQASVMIPTDEVPFTHTSATHYTYKLEYIP